MSAEVLEREIVRSGAFTVMLASGVATISADEAMVLASYRAIRQQGGGRLFIEFQRGSVLHYTVQPDYGNAKLLNLVIQQTSDPPPS